MKQKQRVFSLFLLSPSSRRAWIEIRGSACGAPSFASPSSRRAWIEIFFLRGKLPPIRVALLAEGVDRNAIADDDGEWEKVALLAEGVDRNHQKIQGQDTVRTVALLAEGVDRNSSGGLSIGVNTVALLAEGVDRNTYGILSGTWMIWSPSSRRAWIEIKMVDESTILPQVALLAEGVDRNSRTITTSSASFRRPPRGGRG